MARNLLQHMLSMWRLHVRLRHGPHAAARLPAVDIEIARNLYESAGLTFPAAEYPVEASPSPSPEPDPRPAPAGVRQPPPPPPRQPHPPAAPPAFAEPLLPFANLDGFHIPPVPEAFAVGRPCSPFVFSFKFRIASSLSHPLRPPLQRPPPRRRMLRLRDGAAAAGADVAAAAAVGAGAAAGPGRRRAGTTGMSGASPTTWAGTPHAQPPRFHLPGRSI
jgi:hypothetical protein